VTKRVVETTGAIDREHRLILDEPLPIEGPSRVKVIVLLPDNDDFDERVWLEAARSNPVLGFLTDPAEDVYTAADGKPFSDWRQSRTHPVSLRRTLQHQLRGRNGSVAQMFPLTHR